VLKNTSETEVKEMNEDVIKTIKEFKKKSYRIRTNSYLRYCIRAWNVARLFNTPFQSRNTKHFFDMSMISPHRKFHIPGYSVT